MPLSPEPAISVVIATHNRARLLAETLDALAGQTRRDIEVVVVDDDSDDGTAELLRERGIRSLRVARGGPGRARQAGWHAATAPIVAFTDDDCVPTPGWLAALAAPIEAGDADVVQGRTRPRPDQQHLHGPWSRTQHVEEANRFFQTCNIAYRREVLERLEGFDPAFTGPRTAGEDTDLGWRALERGYRVEFAPAALVHHAVWPSSYLAYLRDRPRWGMIVQVVQKHPESRALAYRRYFYRPSHLRALAGGIALVAAGGLRRWLPPVVVAGAVAAHLARPDPEQRPAAERLLLLGQTVVADATEVAVFLQASVRYRTLLL